MEYTKYGLYGSHLTTLEIDFRIWVYYFFQKKQMYERWILAKIALGRLDSVSQNPRKGRYP